MTQVQSTWWGRTQSLFSGAKEGEPASSSMDSTAESTATTSGKVVMKKFEASLAKFAASKCGEAEEKSQSEAISGETTAFGATSLSGAASYRGTSGPSLLKLGSEDPSQMSNEELMQLLKTQDATSSTRGDSTASHSTASCWSSKTPPTEAELPSMAASLTAGSRGTAPASIEERLGLAANGFANSRSKPLLPVPTEANQDASALGTAPLMASAVLPPPSIAAPSTPGPSAPPPSPVPTGEEVAAGHALESSTSLHQRDFALPKGEDKLADLDLSFDSSNGQIEKSNGTSEKKHGALTGSETAAAAKLVLHNVTAPPASSASTALSSAPLPQLHCSEFLQVIIEKQHEVDRFVYASEEDLSSQTLTKMAMMKGELDRLSVSISSILGKSSPNSSCVVAPPPGSSSHGSSYTSGGHRNYMDQVLRPAQIWPIVDAVPAPYPTEVEIPEPAAPTSTSGYQSSLVDPPAPAPQTSSSYNTEDHQGPAIFQGFQPPPSYAWGRPPVDGGKESADEPTTISPKEPKGSSKESKETAGAESQSAAAASSAEASSSLPVRVKSIDMTTPPPGRTGEMSMKQALAAAMDELKRCQSKCQLLRTEKRGVPAEELEVWCGSITKKLQAIGDGLEKKLETQKVKSRAKDDTIKRLHKKLQAAQQAANDMFFAPSASPHLSPTTDLRRISSSPATDLRGGLLSHDSSTQQIITPRLSHISQDVLDAAPGAALSAGTSPLPTMRTPRVSGPGESGIMTESDINIGVQDSMTEEAAMLTWPPGGESQMLHRARGRFQGGDGETSLARLGIQAVGGGSLEGVATMPQINAGSPSSTATTRASSSTQMGEDKQPSARGNRHVASQKNLRNAAQVQSARNETQGQLRREVNPRRRDVDLACQLQAKQQQVDQLQATLRELQLVTSRQIGLYKRQLHLKEHSLQALQEELMLDRGQQQGNGAAVATPVQNTASAPSNSETSARGNRRAQQVQGGSLVATPAGGPGLGHSASQRRTGRGGDRTPRPGDDERGRPTQVNSTNSTWPAPAKKDPRERSLGALPHSPRAKHRDVVSHQPAAEAQGASRRRTSPPGPGPALGRSTSAEERGTRRRDAEPPSAPKVYRSRDSGAATARHRR